MRRRGQERRKRRGKILSRKRVSTGIFTDKYPYSRQIWPLHLPLNFCTCTMNFRFVAYSQLHHNLAQPWLLLQRQRPPHVPPSSWSLGRSIIIPSIITTVAAIKVTANQATIDVMAARLLLLHWNTPSKGFCWHPSQLSNCSTGMSLAQHLLVAIRTEHSCMKHLLRHEQQ